MDALCRYPSRAAKPPGTARRYLNRSRATPCVDAFRRHPPHASKPPGMARRYLNRSEPRHAWMLFADTNRARQSRRAWPGATGSAVEPRRTWMLFAHANRAKRRRARPGATGMQDRSRSKKHQAAFRRPDDHSISCDQKKIAYRINSGIGTPNSQSRIIFMAGLLAWNAGYRSRRRPPQVALRLAKNAPISRVMNSHSAA